MPGERRYRLITVRRDGPDAAPTQAEFQAALDARAPSPVRVSDVTWLAQFRLHHRVTDAYRRGRLFLAGDAAHIHSPAGGQGMNTGIQDAFNLGWKLAMACRGRGGEALLDSYHAERLPVGQRLMRTTDRMFSGIASPSRLVAFARERVIQLLAPWVLGNRARRAAAFRFISQLGISYRRSGVVLPGDGPGPRGGDRAPDGPLTRAGGAASTLFHALHGTGHHLLAWDCSPSELGVARQLLQPLLGELAMHAPSAGDAVLRARFGVRGPALHLIRPDGHLWGRVQGADATPLAALLRRALSS
jgi:hypothetical protein